MFAFDKPEEAAVGGGMMGAAINAGGVYAHLARDLITGQPGFEHALHNARLIEAVARAADRGMRQKLGQGAGVDDNTKHAYYLIAYCFRHFLS
jgi:predicted dehydrogenase